VPVGEGGDLGQMRDDEHLTRTGEAREAAAHGDPRPPADARVHLVEDERRDLVEIGEDASAREHHSGELPSRAGSRERQLVPSGDGREPQLNSLGPVGSRIRRLERHPDGGALHAELPQLDLQRLRQLGRASPPRGRHAPGELRQSAPEVLRLGLQAGPFVLCAAERLEPRLGRREECEDLGLVVAVLALEIPHNAKARACCLETIRIGLRRLGVPANLPRELGHLLG
jgi:hypothetical protein